MLSEITNTDLQHFSEELRGDSLSAVVRLHVEVLDDGDRVVGGVARSLPLATSPRRPLVQSVEEEDVADEQARRQILGSVTSNNRRGTGSTVPIQSFYLDNLSVTTLLLSCG